MPAVIFFAGLDFGKNCYFGQPPMVNSYTYHLISELHGSNDIKHVRSFPYLFFIKQVKMGETGSAYKDMEISFIQFL